MTCLVAYKHFDFEYALQLKAEALEALRREAEEKAAGRCEYIGSERVWYLTEAGKRFVKEALKIASEFGAC